MKKIVLSITSALLIVLLSSCSSTPFAVDDSMADIIEEFSGAIPPAYYEPITHVPKDPPCSIEHALVWESDDGSHTQVCRKCGEVFIPRSEHNITEYRTGYIIIEGRIYVCIDSMCNDRCGHYFPSRYELAEVER